MQSSKGASDVELIAFLAFQLVYNCLSKAQVLRADAVDNFAFSPITFSSESQDGRKGFFSVGNFHIHSNIVKDSAEFSVNLVVHKTLVKIALANCSGQGSLLVCFSVDAFLLWLGPFLRSILSNSLCASF